MTDRSTLDQLAAFAVSVFSEETAIPQDTLSHGKRVIADTFAAIMAGRDVAEIGKLGEGLQSQTGPLLGALVDGAAGVALELDEGCAPSRGHPAIHILPAGLHTARAYAAAGAPFLRAFIAAYEVAARIGHATTFRPAIHPHGTWGTCGAATIAGLLRGLDGPRLASALKIAGALPVATHYNTVYAGATARNLWSGIGNLNGMLAVEAAMAGLTGNDDALAGTMGDTLGTAFASGPATADLGARWFINENYFKQYPCCRHAHVAIDAYLSILAETGAKADEDTHVRVETYQRAADAVGRIAHPRTPLQAKFSLPFIIAAATQEEALNRQTFEGECLERYAADPLTERVSVVAADDLTARLPQRSARVTVTLADGRKIERARTGSHGDPTDPLSAAELEDKFVALVAPVLGADAARHAYASIGRLEQIGTVSERTLTAA